MELSEAPVMEPMKRGFKNTEVGEIPEDWIITRIGEIARVVGRIGYRGYTENDIVKPGEGAIALSPSNIQSGAMNYGKRTHISWYKYEESPEIKIENGDILIVKIGSTVGKVALVKALPEKATLNPQMVVLKNIAVNNVLLASLMNSRIVQDQMINAIVGGALPTLSQKQIASFVLPVPSTYDEQCAIATALSDVDALLGSLDALIAKKKAIKHGAMQQLLTGKQRLKGFEGEWVVKRFDELATPRKERVDPRRSGPHAYCLELEHIEQGTGRVQGHTIAAEGSSLKSVFREGDVLFGKLRAYLRKYWIANQSGVCSTEIWALVANPATMIPAYLIQIVTLDSFIEVASTAYGTHMPRSDWNLVRALELRVPRPQEQTAIAEVLSDMDAEIGALEARRSKTALLKQGVMQELLTGRKRLV